MIVEARRFADLDALTLYGILRLRVDVFIVEQQCSYPELDGRDTEVDALHFWIADDSHVLATLRLLSGPEGSSRIGRVATHADHRGKGLAARLMRAALENARRPVVLDAQVGLEDWYEQFGFTVSGAEFDDGGVPHVPMRLA